jgi:molybdenum cofactor biosynthesis enzyme
MDEQKLTLQYEQGRARMVDSSEKADTGRTAVSSSVVTMKPEPLAAIK